MDDHSSEGFFLMQLNVPCTCAFHTLHQVSRSDHENLAKRYDQVCAQVRMLQHDKDQLDRVRQEKLDLENKYYDEIKRYGLAQACSLLALSLSLSLSLSL